MAQWQFDRFQLLRDHGRGRSVLQACTCPQIGLSCSHYGVLVVKFSRLFVFEMLDAVLKHHCALVGSWCASYIIFFLWNPTCPPDATNAAELLDKSYCNGCTGSAHCFISTAAMWSWLRGIQNSKHKRHAEHSTFQLRVGQGYTGDFCYVVTSWNRVFVVLSSRCLQLLHIQRRLRHTISGLHQHADRLEMRLQAVGC